MKELEIIRVGLKPYLEILQLQEQLFIQNVERKQLNQPTQNYLILCEHEAVFTLGKSGKRENILVSDEEMNAAFYHVNRGGDVTFHGPGQLVVYPILDLDSLQIGLSKYVCLLEECIIQSIKRYGLEGERIEGVPGIWLKKSQAGTLQADSKIGAIGVKASRNVTMHGIAINVQTDLSYFDKIIPCGLQGKNTTSIYKETGDEVTVEQFRTHFESVFLQLFALVESNHKISSL